MKSTSKNGAMLRCRCRKMNSPAPRVSLTSLVANCTLQLDFMSPRSKDCRSESSSSLSSTASFVLPRRAPLLPSSESLPIEFGTDTQLTVESEIQASRCAVSSSESVYAERAAESAKTVRMVMYRRAMYHRKRIETFRTDRLEVGTFRSCAKA